MDIILAAVIAATIVAVFVVAARRGAPREAYARAPQMHHAGHVAGSEPPLRPSVYAEGPPVGDDALWSETTGVAPADDLNAGAAGIYVPGGHWAPKRAPGWAIRPGHRRTNWV